MPVDLNSSQADPVDHGNCKSSQCNTVSLALKILYFGRGNLGALTCCVIKDRTSIATLLDQFLEKYGHQCVEGHQEAESDDIEDRHNKEHGGYSKFDGDHDGSNLCFKISEAVVSCG